MKELTNNEKFNITGGAVTTTIINSIVRMISTIMIIDPINKNPPCIYSPQYSLTLYHHFTTIIRQFSTILNK